MNRAQMMERARYIKHRDRQILLYDFSHLSTEEARQLMDYCPGLIRNMPPQSVLTLTDVTGLNFDEQLKEAFKALTQHNKPYVIAGAVVGVTGWKKIVYLASLRFAGRNNLQLFDTVALAREWLADYRA